MTEARYRGQKVVVGQPRLLRRRRSSPTSGWRPRPGTDGALAMAMGHVVLKEFFVDRQTPCFADYVKQLHRPAVPGDARGAATARFVPDSSSPPPISATTSEERGVQDRAARRPHRRAGRAERLARLPLRRAGVGRWNLDLGDVDPLLTLSATARTSGRRRPAALRRPRRRRRGSLTARGVPVRAIGGRLVPPFRPAAGPVRRRPARAAGRVADRLRRPVAAVHPGLAGGDHRRARRRGSAHRRGSSRRTPRSPAAAR